MARIFTLLEGYENDKRCCLNGKCFFIKAKVGAPMFLYDATDKGRTCLWMTSDVLSVIETSGIQYKYLDVETRNSKYQFVDVATVIPTALSLEADSEEVVSNDVTEAAPIEMVNSTRDYKPIHYGDGYDLVNYEFNRDITREEFISWCEENKLRTNERPRYPFESYAEISGAGTKWTHKTILCYTD